MMAQHLAALCAGLALIVVWFSIMPKETRGKSWHYVLALVPLAVILAAAYLPEPSLRKILDEWLEMGFGVLGVVALAWLLGTRLRNHGVMDILYPITVIVVTAIALRRSPEPVDFFSATVSATVVIWGLRLAIQTYQQNIHAEREPYAHWRAKFGKRWLWWSAFQIHLLQAGMLWLWVAPIVFALFAPTPRPRSITALGAAVWLSGFLIQAISDRQLTAFRRNPSTHGQLLDTGLWSLVRHPNYLGEALMWSGWFVFALAHPWGWLTVFSPVFNAWFMGYASAAPFKEQHMARTRGSAWVSYCERTPRFFPWPRPSARAGQ